MCCVKGLDINEEVGANLAKSLTDEGYGEGLRKYRAGRAAGKLSISICLVTLSH